MKTTSRKNVSRNNKKSKKTKKTKKSNTSNKFRKTKINKLKGGTVWANKCAICAIKFKWTSERWITKFGDKPVEFNSVGTNSNKNTDAEPLIICNISELPCGHMFHTDCINDSWNFGNSTCPSCRAEYTKEQILPVGSSLSVGRKSYDKDYFIEMFNEVNSFNINDFTNTFEIVITDDVLISMVEALKVNTTITVFEYKWNRYGHPGALNDDKAIILAEVLKVNTTLTTFSVGSNKINDRGAIAFAEALRVNTTLKVFDINNNEIGNDGAIAFAETLKINTTLKEFDITTNIIMEEGQIELEKAVEANRTLTKFELYGFGYIPGRTPFNRDRNDLIETYIVRNRQNLI